MGDSITARIPRAELLGLLNTMTPHEQQAITAELVRIEMPIETEIAPPIDPPIARSIDRPSEHAIEPAAAKRPFDMVVVAAACALSLAMGTILLALV